MAVAGAPSRTDPMAHRPVSPDRLWLGALVVLVAGIVLHGVRAYATGWLPSADDGYWAIMARSVFSAHPPLLGSSSSGGLTSGTGFHHLGPLGFYLLAPFVAVLGGVGVAVGSSVLNATAAVLAAQAVRSSVGPRAGWCAAVGGALLAYAMGSELLVDPWNPHLATMPLWLGLCCAWAALRSGVWWAPVGLVALSLSIQTHLSFVPIGGLAALTTVVALVWWSRTRGEPEGARWWQRRWAPALVALGVTLLANLPVLVQQFFAAGPGNLGRALTGSGDQGDTIGAAAGLQLLSQPLLQLWNWLPGSWREQVIATSDLGPAWIVTVTALGLVAVVVVAVRRREHDVALPVGFAALLLVAGAVVAGTLPFRFFGAPMALARWVWPLALFVQIVALDAVVRLVTGDRAEGSDSERHESRSVWVAVAGCVVVVLLTGLNLVPRDEGSGAVVAHHDAIREAIDQAEDELAGVDHPLVPIPMSPIANDAAVALLDWFDQRGTPFSLDDPVALRQAGTQHAADGGETHTVVVRGGASVLDPVPEGLRTVATVNPLGEQESAWYLGTRARVVDAVGDFADRAASDAELLEAVGLPRSAGAALATGWRELLCGGIVTLPTGNGVVQSELIDDAERERLCELDDALAVGALSIHLGPPPQA